MHLIDYVGNKCKVTYLSDLHFTIRWIEIIRQIIEREEIQLFPMEQWDDFFEYVLSKPKQSKFKTIVEIRNYYNKIK